MKSPTRSRHFPFAVQCSLERLLCRAHCERLVDLSAPTPYRPGTASKAIVLSARRILGLPHVPGDPGSEPISRVGVRRGAVACRVSSRVGSPHQ